MHVPN